MAFLGYLRSSRLARHIPGRPLTLFGRSLLLLVAELTTNAICWIVAGVLFGRKKSTQPVLSLALLAWTIGLRHALDADHIRYYDSEQHQLFSAIDNATRSLMNLGQLPVTCGLFFSLGHSTIVIVVNVAIAISTSVYDHIDGVGKVGGIVGAAVSATFLFIVGLANSIILWKILSRRRKLVRERARRVAQGEDPAVVADDLQAEHDKSSQGNTLMMKIIGPIVTFVDRPWKMYPVGVLFGFGFDTASSIALLAVTAIAKKGTDGSTIAPADVVILPLLFTAGMTLIDSVDSILMLYSYSGFPDRSFAIFEQHKAPIPSRPSSPSPNHDPLDSLIPSAVTSLPFLSATPTHAHHWEIIESNVDESPATPKLPKDPVEVMLEPVMSDQVKRDLRVKRNAMSGLSVLLTLMSILVAFSISLITIMGLVGENCSPCQEAAEADDGHGGGVAGRWWRGWAKANDNSGYIGAAIVGAFVFIVCYWYGSRYLYKRWKTTRVKKNNEAEVSRTA